MKLKRTRGNQGKTATLVITYSNQALGILGAAGFDNDNSASSPVENAAYDEAQSTPPLGTTPRSFVGLADKLAPTVVNVKVTKVTQA